jgi:glutathione synthase
VNSVQDTFTQKLLHIYRTALSEGVVQTKVLGIHRSDYMLHVKGDSVSAALKQVEMNRISAAFGALSTLTGQLHRYLIEQLDWTHRYPLSALPVSESRTLLAAHLARAHQLYGRSKSNIDKRILFFAYLYIYYSFFCIAM